MHFGQSVAIVLIVMCQATTETAAYLSDLPDLSDLLASLLLPVRPAH